MQPAPETHVLTMAQPWASALVTGLLWLEFRRWSPPGWAWHKPLVIHASHRQMPRDAAAHQVDMMIEHRLLDSRDPERLARLRLLVESAPVLPRSAALGSVKLLAPIKGFNKFARAMEWRGPLWGWPVRDACAWDKPLHCAGAPGIWRWPADVPNSPIAELENR